MPSSLLCGEEARRARLSPKGRVGLEWWPRDGQNRRQADGDGRTVGSCAAAAHCGPVAVGAAAGAARESDDACSVQCCRGRGGRSGSARIRESS